MLRDLSEIDVRCLQCGTTLDPLESDDLCPLCLKRERDHLRSVREFHESNKGAVPKKRSRRPRVRRIPKELKKDVD